MKKVTTKAVYDYSKCTGCHTCTYVCPFYVVTNPEDRPLEKAAPEVNERVENELLPKWMSQKGIDPKILQQLP